MLIRNCTLLVMSFVALLCSCGLPSSKASKDKALHAELIKFVDHLPIPIKPESIVNDPPKRYFGVVGVSVKVDQSEFPTVSRMIQGQEYPILAGTLKEPKGLIFYLPWCGEEFYIPFKSVTTVDRERKLIKVSERVYLHRGGASWEGELANGKLP